MFDQNYLICLNATHETIMLDFLNDIQAIIDVATERDEDYDSFLNILANIIMHHNENGEMAYRDTIFRNNWLYNLPSMVYWASIGYISGIRDKNEDLPSVASKLAVRLARVNDSIGRMILYDSNFDNDDVILN